MQEIRKSKLNGRGKFRKEQKKEFIIDTLGTPVGVEERTDRFRKNTSNTEILKSKIYRN